MPLTDADQYLEPGPTVCRTCGADVSEHFNTFGVPRGTGKALPCGHEASPSNLKIAVRRVDVVHPHQLDPRSKV